MIGRWRGRRREDQHERLIEDIRRVAGLMSSVIASARRIEVEVPTEITESIVAWRSWADRLAEQEPGR